MTEWTKRPVALTESAMMNGIIEYARRLGYIVLHVTVAKRSETGWPDVFCAGYGVALAFEVKTQKGRLRPPMVTKRGRVLPGQQDWLDALNNAGIQSWVVRPEASSDAIGYDDALGILNAASLGGLM
jgi:hypothetical protein